MRRCVRSSRPRPQPQLPDADPKCWLNWKTTCCVHVRRSTIARVLTELDIEFHQLVAKAAKNRAIDLARQALSGLFYPAFYSVMSRLKRGRNGCWRRTKHIVAAIRNSDVVTARNWMERHIDDFRRGYELANLDMMGSVKRSKDVGPG